MRVFLSTTILATALLATQAGAASLNYSFTVIQPTGFTNGSSGQAFDYSINSQGTVARQVARDGAFNVPFNAFIETIDTDGTVGNTFLNRDGRASASHSPVINDAGQVLTVRSTGPVGDPTNFAEELVRVEADGSVTVLAQQSGDPENTSHPNQFFFVREFEASINNNGDVVAIVETLDRERQIVKFAQDGQSFEVIASETGGLSLSGTSRVDINDSGQVAFTAFTTSPTNGSVVDNGVYVAENGTLELTFRHTVGSSEVAINNDGDILVTSNDSAGHAMVIHRAGTEETAFEVVDTAQTSFGPRFSAPNLNNFGQAAYIEGGRVVIDGERLIGGGDTLEGRLFDLDGNPLQALPSPLEQASIRGNVNFNDLGQAIVDVRAQDGQRTILRADPEGSTVATALLPFASTPEGENDVALNIFNGLGVLAPIFVDPIVATGFTYTQGIGGENFASLLIPDALPLGDDEFTVEFDIGGTLFSETLFAGQTLDFTGFDPLGISMFSILGIDITEAIDPTDPFVVGLTFVNGGFSSTLSIDAITVDTDATVVPLPGSAFLLLAGLAGLGFVGRRRRI